MAAVQVYIRLLQEGTECSRPTQALDLGDGLYRVLPVPGYASAEELWEFPPNSIVRVEVRRPDGKELLLAVAP